VIVLLTRHGRTNFNDMGLCNADPLVDVYLTKEGIQQAKALATKLTSYDIQKAYVSDLPRTTETANYCLPSQDIPTVQDYRLSDIKTGFESKPVQDFLEYIEPDPLYLKAPGGESFQDLKSRIHSFMDDLCKTREECILIVTHMDPAKVIKGLLQSLSDAEMWSLEVQNCELLEFRLN